MVSRTPRAPKPHDAMSSWSALVAAFVPVGAVFGLFVWLAVATAGSGLAASPSASGGRFAALASAATASGQASVRRAASSDAQATRRAPSDGSTLERGDGGSDERSSARDLGAVALPPAASTPVMRALAAVTLPCPVGADAPSDSGQLALPAPRAPPAARATL